MLKEATQKFASIIPLNYGTHTEYSAVLVDPVWTDLIELLTHPQHWLARERKRWGSESAALGSIPWKLNAPATAVIRPILSRPDLAPLISGLFPYYTQVPEPIPPDSGLWSTYLQEYWPVLFKNGFFVVEFAIDTSMLFISYLPPLVPDPNGPHYKKDLTDPTVSFLQFPALQKKDGLWNNLLASVHCDLTDNSTGGSGMTRHDRARFAVDMLESRQGFANKLNESSGFLESYTMIAEGNPIDPTRNETSVAFNSQDPEIKFHSISTSLGGESDFVTITIEGLMNKSLADTCCITSTPQIEKTTDPAGKAVHYVLMELALKDYQSDDD